MSEFALFNQSTCQFASYARRFHHRLMAYDIISRQRCDQSRHPSKRYKAACLAASLLNNAVANCVTSLEAEWPMYSPVKAFVRGRYTWLVGRVNA